MDRRGGISEVRPPGQRPGAARPVVPFAPRDALTAPLAGGARRQRHQRPAERIAADVDALRALGRNVEQLLFDDDGHEIDKRENRAVLVKAMGEWLTTAFASGPDS